MSFGFDPEEKWDVSTDQWMPIGNHVATIVYIEAEQPSSGGYPMLEVKTERDDGLIARDWIVISGSKTFGKFTALVLAAGIPADEYPKPGDDFDPVSGKISQGYATKLLRRKVGVIIRARQDKPDQGEVKGYVLPSEVTDDLPPDTRGLPPSGGPPQGSGGSGRGKKIPF